MKAFYKKFIYKYEPIFKPIGELEDLLYSYYGVDRVDVKRKSFDDIASTIGEEDASVYFKDNRDFTLIENLEEKDLEELFDNIVFKTHVNSYICTNVVIYIHYPSITITNEYNTKHNITNLYVKLLVNYQGILNSTFEVTRSEFSEIEFNLGYIHSHVTTFDNTSYPDFSEGKPCIGKGPIRNTIGNLNIAFDKDLWNLFFLELDKFLETESISGGPYLSINNLVSGNIIPLDKPCSSLKIFGINEYIFDIKNFINKFIDYCVENSSLQFVYKINRYILGNSLLEYNILITNVLYEYIEKKHINIKKVVDYLEAAQILIPVYIDDTNVYRYNETKQNDVFSKDITVLTFKDTPVKLKVKKESNSDTSKTILNPKISSYILFTLLKFINVNYGKSSVKSKILLSYNIFRIRK